QSTEKAPKLRTLRHHAKIAPHPQFHSAGDSGSFDRRDNRLVQFKARRSQWAARNVAAVATRPGGRDVELAQRIIGIQGAHIFEIPAGAKCSARPVEYGD